MNSPKGLTSPVAKFQTLSVLLSDAEITCCIGGDGSIYRVISSTFTVRRSIDFSRYLENLTSISLS
ncbi:hypothetical protein [Nostoc sp.]|uniref:hypothetical protein n=1 Tax=Nostoc sp. TaxID=1180 RepID=UPI002FFBC794